MPRRDKLSYLSVVADTKGKKTLLVIKNTIGHKKTLLVIKKHSYSVTIGIKILYIYSYMVKYSKFYASFHAISAHEMQGLFLEIIMKLWMSKKHC